jgi:hypothetical protein
VPATRQVLDEFIPDPDARERFQVNVAAPPDVVMRIARAFDVQSIPLVRGIFAMRALLTRSTRVTRVPMGLVDEMRSIGWGVLRENSDRLFVAGAVCQPWLADVRFHAVPAGAFLTFDEPGQVKIAWTLESLPRGTGTVLASETRAVATDATARSRFLRYWRWARFGIIPIRWLLLPAVARRAEAEWRSRSPSPN